MSQWGVELEKNGARFVSHVETDGFLPIRLDSIVSDIFLIDHGGNIELAEQALDELKAKYVGKPYIELAMLHGVFTPKPLVPLAMTATATAYATSKKYGDPKSMPNPHWRWWCFWRPRTICINLPQPDKQN